MKLTHREKEIYWTGFFDGKNNALKHNITIMKLQIDKKEHRQKRKK